MIKELGTRRWGSGRGSGSAARARPTLLTPVFVRVALAELAYFTADGVLVPTLPRYVSGPLGGGNAAVGLVIGVISVSAFLLRPWAGRAADRRGRRALMVAGASLFAVSVLGYLVATSVPVLAALRLLTGAGEALFFVGAVSANMDLAPPERRGEAMSFASLSLYIGIGAGPLIGEAAVAWGGFAAAWTAAVAFGLVAVGLSLRLPAMRPQAGDGAAGPHRLVHPAGLLPGLILLTAIWGMGGFLAFVPLYVGDLGISGSGALLGLFAGIVVAIRSLGARIPDRLGAGTTTRVSLALTASGLALIGLWRSPAGLVLGTVLLGVGVALFTPAVFALAVEGVPAGERGAVMGTTSAFLDLAFGLGPASLGVVAAAVGRGGTFVVGAAVAVAGLAIVHVTRLGIPSAGDREYRVRRGRPSVPRRGSRGPRGPR